MKNALLVCVSAALLAAVPSVMADEYADYIEALTREFQIVKEVGPVRVTVRPRLLELVFAEEVQTAQAGEQRRAEMVEEWKPKYAELRQDGYVFDVEFYLLNQNLDAGIEIEFHGDWRNGVVLVNNNDVTSRLYRTAGDESPKLDFMYPERKVQCYFNTCDVEKQPLLDRGVHTVKLCIAKFCEELPDIEFSWTVPLWYGDVPRPPALSSWFGGKHLRTLWPYKEQVYHEPVQAPLRMKRVERVPNAMEAQRTPSPPAPDATEGE